MKKHGYDCQHKCLTKSSTQKNKIKQNIKTIFNKSKNAKNNIKRKNLDIYLMLFDVNIKSTGMSISYDVHTHIIYTYTRYSYSMHIYEMYVHTYKADTYIGLSKVLFKYIFM